MVDLLKIFLIGTFISMICVPFLLAQNSSGSFNSKLSISNKQPATEQFTIKNLIRSFKDSNALKDSTFTVKDESVKKFRMKKQPWKAVLFSALLPGAGQFYNRSYWKVPILLGLTGYLAYEWNRENNNYRDYRDQYSTSQTPQNPDGDGNLKALREFYRSQRNDFTWYFIIVYFVNLVDAYIDAHLFDFDVKDEKMVRGGISSRTYRINMHLALR